MQLAYREAGLEQTETLFAERVCLVSYQHQIPFLHLWNYSSPPQAHVIIFTVFQDFSIITHFIVLTFTIIPMRLLSSIKWDHSIFSSLPPNHYHLSSLYHNLTVERKVLHVVFQLFYFL